MSNQKKTTPQSVVDRALAQLSTCTVALAVVELYAAALQRAARDARRHVARIEADIRAALKGAEEPKKPEPKKPEPKKPEPKKPEPRPQAQSEKSVCVWCQEGERLDDRGVCGECLAASSRRPLPDPDEIAAARPHKEHCYGCGRLKVTRLGWCMVCASKKERDPWPA